jgi:hypothetical protein
MAGGVEHPASTAAGSIIEASQPRRAKKGFGSRIGPILAVLR